MGFKKLRKFFRKQYRNVFGTSITGTTAAQIRAMREKEGWNQQQLAEKAEMGQARISLLENPNYQNLSLNTLKRIANVFDVALVVRFVPFSKLFVMLDNETQETLAVPSFEDEFGTEANPITTPSEKIGDMAEYLKMLHLQAPQGTALNPDTSEARSGAGAVVMEVITPAAGMVLDAAMDKYKPKVGEQIPLLELGGSR